MCLSVNYFIHIIIMNSDDDSFYFELSFWLYIANDFYLLYKCSPKSVSSILVQIWKSTLNFPNITRIALVFLYTQYILVDILLWHSVWLHISWCMFVWPYILSPVGLTNRHGHCNHEYVHLLQGHTKGIC